MTLKHPLSVRIFAAVLVLVTLLAIVATGAIVLGSMASLIVLFGSLQVWFQRVTLSAGGVVYRNRFGRSVHIPFDQIVGMAAAGDSHFAINRRGGRRIVVPWRMDNLAAFARELHSQASKHGPVELRGDIEELLAPATDAVR